MGKVAGALPATLFLPIAEKVNTMMYSNISRKV